MPLYEYICENCHKQLELLVRGSEQPRCPHCEGEKLTRLLSVPAGHVAKGGSLPICDGPKFTPCGMGGCGRPECGF